MLQNEVLLERVDLKVLPNSYYGLPIPLSVNVFNPKVEYYMEYYGSNNSFLITPFNGDSIKRKKIKIYKSHSCFVIPKSFIVSAFQGENTQDVLSFDVYRVQEQYHVLDFEIPNAYGNRDNPIKIIQYLEIGWEFNLEKFMKSHSEFPFQIKYYSNHDSLLYKLVC